VKVDVPFNVYDFLGYILPGLLATWAAQVLIGDVLRLPFPLRFGADATETSFFIVVAFVVGHLLQGIAEFAEPLVLKRKVETVDGWKRLFPSQQFRRESDEHFSAEFKSAFEERASRLFGLPAGAPEAFDLAYTYIVLNTNARHTEAFNAIYGLHRGLIVASLLAAAVYLAQTVDSVSVHPDGDVARQSAIIASLLAASVPLAFTRARRFSVRFADSVYRSFVASASAGSTREGQPEGQ